MMQTANQPCTISAYHFELLLESSRPGLCKEIETYHYSYPFRDDQSIQLPSSGRQKTNKKKNIEVENTRKEIAKEVEARIGYGKIRLLVIAAFLNGPRDFIYLHLPTDDTTEGELLIFKKEQEAIQYFSNQKKQLMDTFPG